MASKTKKKFGFGKGFTGFTGSSALYDLFLNQGQGMADIGKALLGLKDGGRVYFFDGGRVAVMNGGLVSLL